MMTKASRSRAFKSIEMSVMNSGILASEAKELAIFDFPFLFANEKESDAIVVNDQNAGSIGDVVIFGSWGGAFVEVGKNIGIEGGGKNVREAIDCARSPLSAPGE